MQDKHQEVAIDIPDDTSVSSNEPKREKKTADRKKYMRDYYHAKQKEEVQCEFCERTFSCKSSMVHHMRKSQKCAITQALVALDELNKHVEILRKFVGQTS
jgi:ribosomal protein S18